MLVSRIRQIFNEKRKLGNRFNTVDNDSSSAGRSLKQYAVKNVEVDVTNFMWLVGISAHMSGYKYIREAILYCIENPEAVNSFTKTLYPYIADKFSVSTQKVERSIRNAIDKAWRDVKPGVKNSIFGPFISNNGKRPKNSEFIALISDRIRMGMK
jgi:two-component system response regulator (stage 0 sporulation protein A)